MLSTRISDGSFTSSSSGSFASKTRPIPIGHDHLCFKNDTEIKDKLAKGGKLTLNI